ncbi:MAG TPA: VanZ family protein [Bacillales bacterium]|nr:VanZ family protein [Bacillales bacterium]
MKRFLVYWLPVLLWAGMIFAFSSQPYEQQDLRPTLGKYLNEDFVRQLFSGVTFHYAAEEVSVEALGATGFIEFFIRKGAHFSVYFVLAVLLFRAFFARERHGAKAFTAALLFSVLYAASDEIHQHFTGGRTPLPLDVALDSTSALIGTFVAFFVIKGKNKALSS